LAQLFPRDQSYQLGLHEPRRNQQADTGRNKYGSLREASRLSSKKTSHGSYNSAFSSGISNSFFARVKARWLPDPFDPRTKTGKTNVLFWKISTNVDL
jgi:hypothetical protein